MGGTSVQHALRLLRQGGAVASAAAQAGGGGGSRWPSACRLSPPCTGMG